MSSDNNLDDSQTPGVPRQRFYLDIAKKAAVGIVLFGVAIVIVTAADETLDGLGFTAVLISLPVFLLGVLALNSVVEDRRACRMLQRCRLDATRTATGGDRVAVNGVLSVQGEPLKSPFGEQACAAYTYLVSGTRQTRSGSSTRTTRQNALHGYHMLPTTFTGDGLTLKIMALPTVETDLTEIVKGDAWGARARQWLDRLVAEQGEINSEADSFAGLLNARYLAEAPIHVDAFVTNVANGATDLSIEEETVPVNEPVALLGTYEALEQGLSGRDGEIVVYRGKLEDVIERLGAEARTYTRIGGAMVLIGGGVCLWPVLKWL